MNEILEGLFADKPLNRKQASELMRSITEEKISEDEIKKILTYYSKRFVTADEILGFRETLLDLAIKPNIKGEDLLDVCGTGGDGKNTFNISTLTALVVAGTGQKVAKHGNYSFSSSCGSSNVLEAMGVRFSSDERFLNESLDKAGICFLHAPLFHPALKNVAKVRKELGIRTIFNLLGPLVNPLKPKYQLTGVSSLEIQELYSKVLKEAGVNFIAAYSYDGYDEISLTGKFRVATKEGTIDINPKDIELNCIKPEDIFGGEDVKSSTDIFSKVLNGEGTEAQNAVVLCNSAYALMLTDPKLNLRFAYEKASHSLLDGKAKSCLSSVISLCQ